MPIDPRLNCAAEICCNPQDALRARIEILCEAGCPDDLAPKIAGKLRDMAIAFTSTTLAEAIAEITDHPGRKED